MNASSPRWILRSRVRSWLAFNLAIGLLFVAAMVLVQLDLRRDLAAAQMASQSELALVGSVITEELRRGHYQRLDSLLREWGIANPRLAELSVIGPDGFVISTYRRGAVPAAALTLALLIDYSYNGRATLNLSRDLDEVYERNATLRDRLLILMITFSGLLGAVLWLLLNRQREARILNERAVALDAAYASLRASEEHLRNIIDIEPECVLLLNATGQIIEINPAGLAMMDAHTLDQVTSKPLSLFVLPNHRRDFQDLTASVLGGSKGTLAFEMRGLNGKQRWLEMYAVPMTQPYGETVLLGVIRDITEHRRAEERLSYLAHFDPLTGLPNRSLFNDRLGQAVIEADRRGRLLAVVFLDLDNFKDVNDSLGHPAGDLLLKSVAARLRGTARRGDTLARLSGDEFAIVFADLKHVDHVARLAQKIIDVFAQPVHIAGRDLFVTASMGITLFPIDARETAELVRNADMAMYRAKAEGRNTYQFFSTAMATKIVDRLSMEDAMRRGLQQGNFLLNYQPIVRCSDGRIMGVEALIRWQDPDHGLVLPEQFVALAEETGLILPLGTWVLNTGCAQLRQWQSMGFPELRLAVNVSTRQIRKEGLDQIVAQALSAAGIAPHHLDIEITESVFAQGEHAEAALRAISATGVQLSIDDFGTGYSSLSYLKRFPIDTLKIDQAFMRDIPGDADNTAIASAIIAMAHKLGIAVVGEGVETADQLQFLEAHGCDYLQGFYLSPPLSAEGVTALLQRPATQVPALLQSVV